LQVAPFANYGPDGRVTQVLASRGRSFAASQTHWFRLADVVAVGRMPDDAAVGQARQLGRVPSSPAFLVRSALARRRLRRAVA
jgi:hypothetical protein